MLNLYPFLTCQFWFVIVSVIFSALLCNRNKCQTRTWCKCATILQLNPSIKAQKRGSFVVLLKRISYDIAHNYQSYVGIRLFRFPVYFLTSFHHYLHLLISSFLDVVPRVRFSKCSHFDFFGTITFWTFDGLFICACLF